MLTKSRQILRHSAWENICSVNLWYILLILKNKNFEMNYLAAIRTIPRFMSVIVPGKNSKDTKEMLSHEAESFLDTKEGENRNKNDKTNVTHDRCKNKEKMQQNNRLSAVSRKTTWSEFDKDSIEMVSTFSHYREVDK